VAQRRRRARRCGHAASAEPARFLGLAQRLGHLAPGRRAEVVALDATDIRVLETWVAGRASGSSRMDG
jgi:N-acetylglucosamine-6-phosphate deacetylase